MQRTPHPLLEQARRSAAELEWRRAACDVCAGRGVLGARQASRKRGDEPEPCPACLGVAHVWLDPHGALFNVEELIEEHARRRAHGDDPHAQ